MWGTTGQATTPSRLSPREAGLPDEETAAEWPERNSVAPPGHWRIVKTDNQRCIRNGPPYPKQQEPQAAEKLESGLSTLLEVSTEKRATGRS